MINTKSRLKNALKWARRAKRDLIEGYPATSKEQLQYAIEDLESALKFFDLELDTERLRAENKAFSKAEDILNEK